MSIDNRNFENQARHPEYSNIVSRYTGPPPPAQLKPFQLPNTSVYRRKEQSNLIDEERRRAEENM